MSHDGTGPMIPLTALPFRVPERLVTSAWIEHLPFMFWMIDALRPSCFVELGTHNGASYCAACQAVGTLDLDCRCYAIDNWVGDDHAGFYGEEIFAELSAHHDPRYKAFSRLVRSTFDEAVEHFDDASINLLHIDGLHSYEAVRHDFETWRPKLADDAIVMFHDTNVRERGFGVFRLWAELAAENRHFEFLHGHGLGVLAMGEVSSPALRALFDAGGTTRHNIRSVFAHLGQTLQLRHNFDAALQRAVADAEQQADDPLAAIEAAFPDAPEPVRHELKAAVEIAYLRVLLNSQSRNADAWISLSFALNRNNRVREAIDATERAIAIAPQPGRYAHLSNLQTINRNWPAAAAAMRRAVAGAPQDQSYVERLKELETQAGSAGLTHNQERRIAPRPSPEDSVVGD